MLSMFQSLLYNCHQLLTTDTYFHKQFFQLAIYQFFKLIMNDCVFKLILFYIFKFSTILVNELLNGSFPHGTCQILKHVFIYPLIFLFYHWAFHFHFLRLLLFTLFYFFFLFIPFEPTKHMKNK
jgi:hypothetical protein